MSIDVIEAKPNIIRAIAQEHYPNHDLSRSALVKMTSGMQDQLKDHVCYHGKWVVIYFPTNNTIYFKKA